LIEPSEDVEQGSAGCQLHDNTQSWRGNGDSVEADHVRVLDIMPAARAAAARGGGKGGGEGGGKVSDGAWVSMAPEEQGAAAQGVLTWI
jgi:hypothetical protein